MRHWRRSLAPILVAKPRESKRFIPILLATSPPVFTFRRQNFASCVNNPSTELRRLGCGMRRYTLSALRDQIKDTHTAQTNRKRDLNIEELLMTNGVNPKRQNPSTLSNLSRISKQPEPQRECGVLEMKAITIIL